jgi:hypothetical protein
MIWIYSSGNDNTDGGKVSDGTEADGTDCPTHPEQAKIKAIDNDNLILNPMFLRTLLFTY